MPKEAFKPPLQGICARARFGPFGSGLWFGYPLCNFRQAPESHAHRERAVLAVFFFFLWLVPPPRVVGVSFRVLLHAAEGRPMSLKTDRSGVGIS